ncbi:anaerobic nitric oxide reductase flavorubredoxin [Caproicibacterium sp. BJN0003]|uniref:anaerobic nitric oxide reductase flavorubredoxin n=1 Tax=Caproicibacterium sp. BJN0003 TaxID=2994078 RepID=UPI00225BC3DC|nr:anaerobic nitric oxide reductase flavorubredoxin [Caproicibacterium sp. BJN0003]UZT81598.1 anaerobic nitric oxide reductase flavorubredoxin [Caproicibacterium sp. BJN0003]
MGKKLTDKVSWVGKIDWELKKFHGNEYSTHRGSSYNSYLVRDRKTALIDTVWQPFDKEFVARLKQEIDLKSIDYIVMNHNEIDHSGALPELMREIPDKPIYCTANGKKIIQGHYHHPEWNFVTVKTGDTLDLGDSKLIFVEAPMLHWPDTMFSYLTGENVLFSNDAFGQHYATESLYNDTVDQGELLAEALKYYANILTPFSAFVTKKIHEVLGLNLPLSMICPSHGVIWRDNPARIVEQYLKWADSYQENQITLVYDTMWNSTRKMAEAIADGIRQADPAVKVKLMNTAKRDKNDVVTEVFRSKAVLVGSPTINNGYLFSIGGIMEMMRGLKFKKKKAAAFGSYGWSGEAVKQLTKALGDGDFEVVNEGHRALWIPDEAELAACREYGKQFAEAL